MLGQFVVPESSDELPEKETTTIPQAAIDEAAHALVRNGILMRDPKQGKPFKLTRFSCPREHLVSKVADRPPCIRLGHIWTFFVACITASHKLRYSSIEETVENVKVRKRKNKTISDGAHLNIEKAQDLVLIFDALRPLYPRNYICTFDSLALIEFLAQYDVFPTWVFGVEVDPFLAHCWVQEDETVFNDHVEMVRAYTPVMAV